ncbi:MAG: sigma-54-dependent Fis family transcriptional regulator [Phycisphaerae bacterium]|nr:sigma-54-dependent Fis family transcriptional regulator [Phycisphaerae bacterium]
MTDKIPILIVEDEIGHADILAEALERVGYEVTLAASGQEGIDICQIGDPYVVITDLKLGDSIDGLGVLENVRSRDNICEVVLITAHESIDTCKEALQKGAYDYIPKPIDLDHLRAVVKRASDKVMLERENHRLHVKLDEKFDFAGIIGNSPRMLRIMDKLNRAANSSVTVLVQGESGVGKELFATAIHFNSPRSDGPFQAVNCAGLSDTLLESELFGHVHGAFTGASADRKGFFQMADGGTLFLDEIGDMPAAMQAKLLRVLEDQIVVPVGSTKGTKVDVRIISATNQDLEKMVEEKTFRQDLYYRIRGVNIEIPPLRQRREDIPELLNHFLHQYARDEGRGVHGFTPSAVKLLKAYDWPGNIRELRNCVKMMVVLAECEKLDVADLPIEIQRKSGEDSPLSDLAGISLTELEKLAIKRTLEMVEGNRETAAKILGIGERTLYRKIKEYDL